MALLQLWVKVACVAASYAASKVVPTFAYSSAHLPWHGVDSRIGSKASNKPGRLFQQLSLPFVNT